MPNYTYGVGKSYKNFEKKFCILEKKTYICLEILISSCPRHESGRFWNMAQLVRCPLCRRSVSSECTSCPGCGHNVAGDLWQKEKENNRELMKKGVCPKCSGREFLLGNHEWIECAKCRESVGTYRIYGNQCNACRYRFDSGSDFVNYTGKEYIKCVCGSSVTLSLSMLC